MQNNREQWSSKILFLFAAIGSAVGLGNIWRFPYIMGEYGGAVFLFVYMFFILTICVIPLICELSIGKYTKRENVCAYNVVNPKLKFFGWINILTATIISSFYFVVGGWIIHYMYINFINYRSEDYSGYFSDFVSLPILPYILTLLFLFLCVFFVYRGVKKGIELGNKIMMPAFLVILIVLSIVSLSLPNGYKGLEFMFKPDMSKISFEMILAALGQSFFTLSIGAGCLLVYGSYMKEKEDVVKNAYLIIFADTIFALLAGIMIFPAVFSFGLKSDSGAGLVFITLPKIFAQIPYGSFFAILFFVLLLFAALTSAISLSEVQTAAYIENFHISRKKAAILVFIIIAILSLPVSLSFGVLSNIKIFSKNFFDLFDFITSNILMPLNSIIICIIFGWFVKIKKVLFFKNEHIYKVFSVLVKYIVPVVLTALMICGLVK